MKAKLRLIDKDKIAYDPETGICWTGEDIIESEMTVFVALALSKKLLVEVKETESEKKKPTKGDKITFLVSEDLVKKNPDMRENMTGIVESESYITKIGDKETEVVDIRIDATKQLGTMVVSSLRLVVLKKETSL